VLKAAAIGLLIAALVIATCQVVSTITYHHVQELAMRYAGATDIPLSTSERFFLGFSTFWARYFVFLSILIVPVSISGAILAELVKSRRASNAA
jgi:hypothetical protein